MLDDYEPLVRHTTGYKRNQSTYILLLLQIPNEVTDFYLQRVGFECEDVRL